MPQPTIAVSILLEGEPDEEMSGKATKVAGEVLANCLYIQAAAGGGS